MNGSRPRVTVVVPLFNKVRTVERTLASIAAQTFTDYEVLVVDDGSTDGGADLVETFGFARVRVIRQPNAGPGAARNRAIAQARGELLAFLDADDEWLPPFLERAVAELDRSGVAAITFGFLEGVAATSNERAWRARGLAPGTIRIGAQTRTGFLVALSVFMNSWATVVRTHVVERHGGFYEHRCTYGEDSYLWLRIALAETIALSFEPLVHWHSEASDLSRNLAGARPVEPILADPEPLYAGCPPAARPVLDRFLAARAGKTACMLSFWGDRRGASRLVRRFAPPRLLGERFVALGYLAATPLGPLAGRALRAATARLPGSRSLGSATWGSASPTRS